MTSLVMVMVSLVAVSKAIEKYPEYCLALGLNLFVYIKILTDLAQAPSERSFSEHLEANMLRYSDIREYSVTSTEKDLDVHILFFILLSCSRLKWG